MSDDWDWETKQKLATIEHWKQRAEGYELRLKAQVRQKHELKAKLEAAEKRVEDLTEAIRAYLAADGVGANAQAHEILMDAWKKETEQ